MRAEMALERRVREAAEEERAAAEEAGTQPAATADKGDNFYQLLQEAKDMLPDNNWWTQ